MSKTMITESKGKNMPKEKVVPFLVNRSTLARELRVPRSSLYLALDGEKVRPDFLMDGQPLYFAHRVTEIAQLLNVPKIV